ncbi:PHP domain-containing protein [bacterium]|nr:PHP domain-containing protein [bacterium]
MDYKELIKSFKKEQYFDKVNLHIHSNFSDGEISPDSIVKQAEELGLEYISITDHNTVNAYLETDLLNHENVIPGIEFDCWYNAIFFHLLAYGIDVHNEELKPFLAKNKRDTSADIVRIFAKRDVKKLIEAIHKANGIAVLAHPACCWYLSMDNFVKTLMKFGLDGIEAYYPYSRHRGIVKFHSRLTAEKVANKYNLIKTGGTDCHSKILF